LLLTRKVGHYAGKQNYLICLSANINKYDILYVDIKGKTKIWENIELKFDDSNNKWCNTDNSNNKIDSKLPWEENGHIVCIHDKEAQTERSGIGFLKTRLTLKKALELDFNEEKQIELLNNINKYFNENPLCFGQPKSINCAILSHVLDKIINN
jgi:hypothetical protein